MIAKGQSAADHVSRWFYHDRRMVRNQTHILELSKPVIACVHGWCMGGGTWLSLTCDMTFCSEDAVFAQPEVRQISNTSFCGYSWQATRTPCATPSPATT